MHRALELLFQLDAPLRTHAAAHDFLATAKTEFEPTYDITGLNLTPEQATKFWAVCITFDAVNDAAQRNFGKGSSHPHFGVD